MFRIIIVAVKVFGSEDTAYQAGFGFIRFKFN